MKKNSQSFVWDGTALASLELSWLELSVLGNGWKERKEQGKTLRTIPRGKWSDVYERFMVMCPNFPHPNGDALQGKIQSLKSTNCPLTIMSYMSDDLAMVRITALKDELKVVVEETDEKSGYAALREFIPKDKLPGFDRMVNTILNYETAIVNLQKSTHFLSEECKAAHNLSEHAEKENRDLRTDLQRMEGENGRVSSRDAAKFIGQFVRDLSKELEPEQIGIATEVLVKNTFDAAFKNEVVTSK